MDDELQAIHPTLSTKGSDMITTLSDSQAAVQTVFNMSKGAPPRSGVEADMKSILVEYADENDIRIAWVRGHIK